jgi:hypothetical protein
LCLLCNEQLGTHSETRAGYYQKLSEDKQRYIITGKTKQLDDFACGILCAHAKDPQCKGIVYREKDNSCFVKFDGQEIATDVEMASGYLNKVEPKGWFYEKVSILSTSWAIHNYISIKASFSKVSLYFVLND